jgi:hypothetical protein
VRGWWPEDCPFEGDELFRAAGDGRDGAKVRVCDSWGTGLSPRGTSDGAVGVETNRGDGNRIGAALELSG